VSSKRERRLGGFRGKSGRLFGVGTAQLGKKVKCDQEKPVAKTPLNGAGPVPHGKRQAAVSEEKRSSAARSRREQCRAYTSVKLTRTGTTMIEGENLVS